MKKIIIGILIIISISIGILFISSLLSSTDSQNSELNSEPKKQLSDLQQLAKLSLKDYNDSLIDLSEFKGKPVIINSWAVWCPFCREELLDFVKLQSEFEDQLKIIAVNRAESLDTAKGYTDEIGISEKLIFLIDTKDKFYQDIGGFTMPETVFINAAGQIVEHKRGFMDLDEMRKIVKKIL